MFRNLIHPELMSDLSTRRISHVQLGVAWAGRAYGCEIAADEVMNGKKLK